MAGYLAAALLVLGGAFLALVLFVAWITDGGTWDGEL